MAVAVVVVVMVVVNTWGLKDDKRLRRSEKAERLRGRATREQSVSLQVLASRGRDGVMWRLILTRWTYGSL